MPMHSCYFAVRACQRRLNDVDVWRANLCCIPLHLDRYNSRNIGVTISKTTENTTYTFTADSKRYKVLAYFGCKGQGYVNYANGAPWLTINADGWKICDKVLLVIPYGGCCVI